MNGRKTILIKLKFQPRVTKGAVLDSEHELCVSQMICLKLIKNCEWKRQNSTS